MNTHGIKLYGQWIYQDEKTKEYLGFPSRKVAESELERSVQNKDKAFTIEPLPEIPGFEGTREFVNGLTIRPLPEE